jgi:hypothetical protein
MRSIMDWFRPRHAPAGASGRDELAPVYFLHIPKTGGTSMRLIMAERYGDRLCPAAMWDDFFRAPELRSTSYDAYAGHFGMDLPKFLRTHMRVFTLLREPIARTRSHYLEVRRTTTHPLHDLVSTQTLRDFVFDPATVPMVVNFQARYLASTGLALEEFSCIFTPYWHSRYTLSVAWETASCYVDTSTLKEAAMSALRSLDFVGLTEDFKEELRRLQKIFGFRSIHVPRSNASPREDADQPIEPDVEQRIRYLTSVDAELYTAAQELRKQSKLTSATTPWSAR